jgi:hypothetical protein
MGERAPFDQIELNCFADGQPVSVRIGSSHEGESLGCASQTACSTA